MALNTDIPDLVSRFTAQIETLIDRAVAERLDRLLGEFRSSILAPEPADHSPTRPARPTRLRRTAASRPSSPAARPIVDLPKPKQATVIPDHVQITRLPPGPVPRESTYSKLRAQCRLPGALPGTAGRATTFSAAITTRH
jgi:hypothetical protein